MVKTYTTNTFASDYKDDYDETKSFHRILFNNKKALQARELTQLQTIIQEGITRFGKNIFKEGAAISPGGIFINAKYRFAKLDTSINALPTGFNDLVGKSFTGQTSGITVQILEVLPAVDGDPATIYIQYLDTSTATAGTTSIALTPGEELSEVQGVTKLTVQTTNTTLNPAVGMGTRISFGEADFFTNGFFVHAPLQHLIISKYTSSITKTVGFLVTQDIVTPADDNSIYDNQGVNPNFTAPGADRFRIQLTLTTEDAITANQTFVYAAKVENSNIVHRVTGEDGYNRINDLIAKRTDEESGDYTVNPFHVQFTSHTTDTKLKIRVSPATAYVNGYRIEKTVPTFLDINKSQTSEIVPNDNTGVGYGHYVLLTVPAGETLRLMPDIQTLGTLNLRTGEGHTGSTIGTCRVRAIENYSRSGSSYTNHADFGAEYKLYIFDIIITDNTKTFGEHCLSIGSDVDKFGNILRQRSASIIHRTQEKCLLVPTTYYRMKAANNISITQQLTKSVVGSGSTSVSISSGGSDFTFTDKDNWLIYKNGVLDTGATTALVSSGASVNITASTVITAADTLTIIAYVVNSAPTIATKTLRNTKATFSYGGAGIDLNEFHVNKINSIRLTSASGSDCSQSFELDDGCKDAFYDMSRLRLKSGKKVAASVIYVDFDYFDISGGDIIVPNSYGGTGFTYKDIPSYTKENGQTVSLQSYLDFRPKKGTDGTFSHASANYIPIPKNAVTVESDSEYYLPRYDRLVIQENGELKYIEGTPSFEPIYPSVPARSMELYRLRVNPFTLDEQDVSYNIVDNKRYTMRDIGKIENRINRVEDAVSLSLLELDTKSIDVLDANGNPRTRSGFVADDFSDQTFTDTLSPDHRASVDPAGGFARPSVNVKNSGLYYDASDAGNSNITVKGDMIFKSYTSVEMIKQALCSSTNNVNPYILALYSGKITLTPSSDDWRNTDYIAPHVIHLGSVLNTDNAQLWDEWEWNWGGTDINDLQIGDATNSNTGETKREVGAYSYTHHWTVRSGWLKTSKRHYKRTETGDYITTGTVVNKVVSSETITEIIGDRQISFHHIPFQRSKLVYFEARGLQPNTQMFAFYDGVDVKDWVKQEAVVEHNLTKQTEYGNLHKDALSHPFGSSTLVTDAHGTLQGSFFIPSTDTLKFPTGATEFRLLDITVDNVRDAVSVASAIYATTGTLFIRQEDIESTRVLNVEGDITNVNRYHVVTDEGQAVRSGGCSFFDPLAQSFLVSNTSGQGTFVTKVDLFFNTKSPTKSVSVELRPMVNGYPHSNKVIPGSQVTLASSQVATSNDALSPTTFEFAYPVYLKPNTSYAIVCYTDNTDYTLFCSKVGEYVLGSTDKKINTQPFLGSLFKSQNSQTWEPSQWEDMKFTLYRADFSTAASTAVLKNANVPNKILEFDPIVLFENPEDHTSVRVKHSNHGFVVGDSVTISGVVDATYASLINGTQTIAAVDYTGYTFLNSSISNPGFASFPVTPQVFQILNTGGAVVVATEQTPFNVMWPTIQSMTPGSTSLSYKMQSMTGKSYAGLETPYTQNSAAAGYNISIGKNNYFPAPQLIASPAKEAALSKKSAIITASLNSETNTNGFVSPVIDLERCSMHLIENIIDNSDSISTSIINTSLNQNVTVPTFERETSAFGGSAAAKHITKSVELFEPAIGIRVIVGANRPVTANIDFYYKACLGDVDYSTEPWILQEPDTLMPADNDPGVFRDYTYTIGGVTGFTDKSFTKFKFKAVLKSTNSSQVPVIRDLRAIALAT